MKHTLTFAFHHIVRLQLRTDDNACAAFMQAEYRPYLTETTAPHLPTVTLTFYRQGTGQPPFQGIPFAHKVLARWRYRVAITPAEVRLDVQGNRWAIPMVHHMLVHPSLRLLAARQGVLMLHAGAVAFGERSIVLTGSGGVGKTTTTSLLLAQGDPRWALHADDYVFLTPEGHTYSYLTRSHLYQPLLSWVPGIRQVLTPAERLRLWLLWLLRRGSHDRLKWPVRLEAQRLWPQRAHCRAARLSAIVWLQRANTEQAVLAPMQPSSEDVDHLLAVNFHEARHFRALLHAHHGLDAHIFPEWQRQERNLLQALAEHARWYRLAIPTQRQDTSFLQPLQALIGEAE